MSETLFTRQEAQRRAKIAEVFGAGAIALALTGCGAVDSVVERSDSPGSGGGQAGVIEQPDPETAQPNPRADESVAPTTNTHMGTSNVEGEQSGSTGSPIEDRLFMSQPMRENWMR